MRYTAAIDDGLTEAQIAQMDIPEARGEFSAEQSAALTLVDHFLRDPRKPDKERAAEISEILGKTGVMEVLTGCCEVFQRLFINRSPVRVMLRLHHSA